MTFWGVEIKPGRPFTLPRDDQGKIQITQATLGTGTLTKRSVVQCNVGDKSPVLICALLPENTEACPLNLQFNEEDEVIFSVLGPRSVHLTGIYGGSSSRGGRDDDDDSDSYGEDIVETDNEADQSADSEEEDDISDFIVDDDDEMVPPSKGRKSAVAIEETDDDMIPVNRNRKRLRKKYQVSDSDVDDENIVVKTHCKVSDSEDEVVPISHLIKKKATTDNKGASSTSETQLAKESKEGNGSSDPSTLNKLDQDCNFQASKAKQISESLKDSSTPSTDIGKKPSTDIGKESSVKEKKKKKRSRVEDEDAKTEHTGDDRVGVKSNEEQPTAIPSTHIALATDVRPKKKNRRNHGEVGEKTKSIDQDCLGIKPEEEQPSDKLFEPSKDSSIPSNNIGLQSDVKPKKKIRRHRGEDVDIKKENMEDPVEIKIMNDKNTSFAGHVADQDNGEVKKKKKKKRAQKIAENANGGEDKN